MSPVQKTTYLHSNPAIFLIGPSGVGKTTVGRILARTMRLNFVDTDREIEKQANKSVIEIFESAGEEVFRDLETKVIFECLNKKGLVVSTGGGSILREKNRSVMRTGIVVYLYAAPEFIEDRLKRAKNRPLLNQGNHAQISRDLMKQRGPLYKQEADMIIRTDQSNAKAIARAIEQTLLSL